MNGAFNSRNMFAPLHVDGVKRSNTIYFNNKVNLKKIIYQTLCEFLQKRYKTYRKGCLASRLGHALGVRLEALGCPGGHFFPTWS